LADLETTARQMDERLDALAASVKAFADSV
jgi:hypothetical protein